MFAFTSIPLFSHPSYSSSLTSSSCRIVISRPSRPLLVASLQQNNNNNNNTESSVFLLRDIVPEVAASLTTAWFVLGNAKEVVAATGEAAADKPDALKEAFKSIPASLVHPVVMGGMSAAAIYAFYLGFQASRVRKVSAEERKELVKGKYGQRHFELASILLATTTFFTFSGMANTYTRTGKLFPGPHLYAGLGLVALLTAMAALSPAMLKGKNAARDAHFAMAFIAVALFAWQANTGLQIVGKLLKWS